MITFDENRHYTIKAAKLPEYTSDETFRINGDEENLPETLVIPEGIKCLEKMGNYFFKSRFYQDVIASDSIKEVICPSTLECINNRTFAGTKLEKIKLNDGLKYIRVSAFSYNYNGSYCCTPKLKEIEIPDSVEYIGSDCFAGSDTLKKVTLGKGIEIITDRAFKECIALEEVIIPESVKYIGQEAFKGCINLKKINLPKSIQWIGKDAFAETGINLDETGFPFCKDGFAVRGDGVAEYYYGSAEEVIVPSYVKKIGAVCFAGTSVRKVVLGENVTSLSMGAFAKCSNLETVVLNKNIKLIPRKCFENSSIKKIEGDVFGLRCVGNHAFSHSGIETFRFPKGFEVVGVSAFTFCKELKEIQFEEGYEEIRNGAFYECKNLKNVICSKFDLKKIHENAFKMIDHTKCEVSFLRFELRDTPESEPVLIDEKILKDCKLVCDADSDYQKNRNRQDV